MSTLRLAGALLTLLLGTYAAGAADRATVKRAQHASSTTERIASGRSRLVAPALPPLQHRLVADDRSNPLRRVLTVGIDRRATTPELSAIARALFKPAAGSTETAHVNFQLDGERAGDAVWAVARVGGDIKVQFIGLSLDEITQLRAEAANDTRAVIGSWLTQPPLSVGRITVYKSASTPFLEWRLRGGMRTTVEMTETRQDGVLTFIDPAGGGERFVLNAEGDLEVRDGAQALVAIGQKVDSFGPVSASAISSPGNLRDRTAFVVPTSAAALLPPPPPPENKPRPRNTGRTGVLPPTWEVRIQR